MQVRNVNLVSKSMWFDEYKQSLVWCGLIFSTSISGYSSISFIYSSIFCIYDYLSLLRLTKFLTHIKLWSSDSKHIVNAHWSFAYHRQHHISTIALIKQKNLRQSAMQHPFDKRTSPRMLLRRQQTTHANFWNRLKSGFTINNSKRNTQGGCNFAYTFISIALWLDKYRVISAEW